MDIATLITVLSQLTLAAAAYNLAKKVSARQITDGVRIDNHEQRIGVLERKAA